MTHIESRPSKNNPGTEYDFFVDCSCTDEQKQQLVQKLREMCNRIKILSRDPKKDEGGVQ